LSIANIDEDRSIRVRVRGVFATALTKLLLDEGFTIVQASRVIKDRFKTSFSIEAADVTIKDVEDTPSTIMVIGYPHAVESILKALLPKIRYYILWRSKLGLYSIVKGKVIEKRDNECVVDLPYGVQGILRNCTNDVGEEVVVSIIRTAVKDNEYAMLSEKLRVIGDYAMLIHGDNRVSVSEHIRDSSKISMLLMLAQKYQREGYGVHWRSSARYASIDLLNKELGFLKEKLDNIIKKLDEYPSPSVIYEGEQLAFITLARPAKEVLDSIRAQVSPTIYGHHMFKSINKELSHYVDFLEYLVSKKRVDPENGGKGLLEFCIDQLRGQDRVEIVHIKPDGTRLRLTPGAIESVEYSSNGNIRITMRRVFRKQGIYDGLNVPKEPGDYDIMTLEYNSWIIIHRYHSRDGRLKGMYININTPPEISSSSIMYYDLLLDIVKKPEGDYELIDVNEFLGLVRRGIISKDIVLRIVSEVKEKIGLDLKSRINIAM